MYTLLWFGYLMTLVRIWIFQFVCCCGLLDVVYSRKVIMNIDIINPLFNISLWSGTRLNIKNVVALIGIPIKKIRKSKDSVMTASLCWDNPILPELFYSMPVKNMHSIFISSMGYIIFPASWQTHSKRQNPMLIQLALSSEFHKWR